MKMHYNKLYKMTKKVLVLIQDKTMGFAGLPLILASMADIAASLGDLLVQLGALGTLILIGFGTRNNTSSLTTQQREQQKEFRKTRFHIARKISRHRRGQ